MAPANPPLPASSVNPDAGDHRITGDPRELAAAARASQRSLDEFVYYGRRFGERGGRFGASDGGWLASLCGGPAAFAREQITWLSAVLSSRGMPTLLLERHLRVLREELAAAAPEKRKSYRVLTVAANALRDARRRVLDEERGAAVAGRFQEVWSPEIPEMGLLLVAAVADERNGIERAVISIEEWATDPERFGRDWIDAVKATIAAARAA